MRILLRRLRRLLRRRKPDIVAVLCPICNNMMNAYGRHYCPIVVESEAV
jgi:Fe-S oxidoreductase